MKTKLLFMMLGMVATICPGIVLGQAPSLGTARSFAIFTVTGAFTNTGTSYITGDIGTNAGALTGSPIVTGMTHVADALSGTAATDVNAAYTSLLAVTCGSTISASLGSNQVLTPNVYCITTAALLTGNLILDAMGDPNALFIFKIDGALSTTTFSTISLVNAAATRNVYWQINGLLTVNNSSVFRGTAIVNGAITLNSGTAFYGHAFSKTGAIEIHDINAVFYDGGLWNGSVNTSFANANNWSYKEVPAAGENIGFVLSPTNHCLLDSNRIIGSIINGTGKDLDLNGYNLSIEDSILLSSTGKLNGSTLGSTLTMVGSTPQLIPAGAFTSDVLENLSLTNNTTLLGALTIRGSLSVLNSTFTSGDYLTLYSDATRDARIAEVVNGSISGEILAQKYIPANGRKYRFLSSPVVGGTTLEWRNNATFTSGIGTHITGSAGTVDVSTSNQNSAFYYDESDVTGGGDINHVTKWDAIDGNSSLANGKGYRVFIRGDRSISLTTANTVNNATTLWVKGTNPASSVGLPVTYTAAAAQGWSLVGNPYASTIDWNLIRAQTATDFSNVDDAMYVWNPLNTTSPGGGYASYVNSVGTGIPHAGTRYISSWQGFFVKANAVAPVVKVKEAHKVSGFAGGNFFKKEVLKPNSLCLKIESNQVVFDDAVVYFEEGASKHFDSKYDAYDLTNGIRFLTQEGDTALAISGMPALLDSGSVKVGVVLMSGSYTFTFSDLKSFAMAPEIHLFDRYLNSFTKITDDAKYTFNVDDANPLTFGNNRFEIRFGGTPTGISDFGKEDLKFVLYPNPVLEVLHLAINGGFADRYNWTITRLDGAQIDSGTGSKGVTSISTSSIANGFYILSVQYGNTLKTVRFVK